MAQVEHYESEEQGALFRLRRMRRIPLFLMLLVPPACGEPEERQPTAAEVRRHTDAIDRAEAEATANAIQTSRAKEQRRDEKHLARVPAQD